MDVRSFFSNPVGAISDWIRAHEAFIAVHVTRVIAVAAIITSAVFLLKSLGAL